MVNGLDGREFQIRSLSERFWRALAKARSDPRRREAVIGIPFGFSRTLFKMQRNVPWFS